MSAALIDAVTVSNCNGTSDPSECRVDGPDFNGEPAFVSAAESNYFHEISADGFSFDARAFAGGMVLAASGYQFDVFSRAASVVRFSLSTEGAPRQGIVKYIGGGGGDGTAAMFGAGFSLFSVDHTCLSRSELCGKKGTIQIQLGVPFEVKVQAFGGGRYRFDSGGRGNGSGATGSVHIELFEADGVTPVKLQLKEVAAVPDAGSFSTSFIGIAALILRRQRIFKPLPPFHPLDTAV
jgi:hypothetical protein